MRARWAACVAALATVAALAGLGPATPAHAAVPPEVIIADTFATRTVTGNAAATFQFSVPAGHWTAVATLTARNNTATAAPLTCTLLIISDNSTNNTGVASTVLPNGQLASLSTGTARTVLTSGVVRLVCQATSSTTTNMSVFHVNIMASKANALTRVNLG
ncbi:hypothetical protein [Nonomuraea zeae]|uniref:Uncharacterized protein n=1 Tax=Nonomuraea zeae TaxID=1642303 RepID=A0A5S4GTB3_9ACTN|nr:hypothetical protein [Nonomuraea zeae]TMR29650.1 hypothetical protein ETD85_31630 [Nonomuraea zeae]